MAGYIKNTGRRFVKIFGETFLKWACTWLGLAVLATIYAAIADQRENLAIMLSVDGWLGILAGIGLGLPVSMVLAGLFCWFSRRSVNDDGI